MRAPSRRSKGPHRARPQADASIKLLKGNPGKKAIRPEPQPTIPETVPEPPAYLVGYGREEWSRVAPELHLLRLLTLLDLQLFGAYCVAYHRWRIAIEKIDDAAKHNAETAGLTIRSNKGSVVHNPLLSIARLAGHDMLRLAAEFGLTPIARARISAPPVKTPSKFDGLLGA